ncbi:hypothetical protein HDU91_003933, partial [Kappamyces sp. JEL0680]
VDAGFDAARARIAEWQDFYSAFGRMSERIGILERGRTFVLSADLAKSHKEVALGLQSLATHAFSSVEQRKCTRYFDSHGGYLHKDSQYRLSTLNDTIIVALEGTAIAMKALDFRITVLQDYEDACKNTQKRLVSMDQLRASRNIKQEKVDAALEEMTVVKRVEQDTREVFRNTSDSLRQELAAYDERQESHLDGLVDEYVRKQIESCESLIGLLGQ